MSFIRRFSDHGSERWERQSKSVFGVPRFPAVVRQNSPWFNGAAVGFGFGRVRIRRPASERAAPANQSAPTHPKQHPESTPGPEPRRVSNAASHSRSPRSAKRHATHAILPGNPHFFIVTINDRPTLQGSWEIQSAKQWPQNYLFFLGFGCWFPPSHWWRRRRQKP